MSKNPDTNLARGLNCLERHQSVKPHKLPCMALCGYSEIVGGSCGASSDNPANVQCVTYFVLTEREGRTGRILPEVVQERLRAIFS